MILSSEAGGEVVSATLRQVSSCLHVRLLLFEPHDDSISSYSCFIVFRSGLCWKPWAKRLPTNCHYGILPISPFVDFSLFSCQFVGPMLSALSQNLFPSLLSLSLSPPFTVSQTQSVSASLRHVTLSDHPRTCVVHLPTDDNVTVNLKSRAQSDCSFFRFRWFLSRCFDAVCAYFNILFFLFLLLPHIIFLYN